MSIRRDLYNEEDTEAARQLKRFLLDELFEQRIKVNEAAARLNVTAERMYKYTNEGSMINNIPAYLLPLWTKQVGSGLLSHLAQAAGYALVELPPAKSNGVEISKTASRAMRECGQVIGRFLDCLEDGTVSEQERREFMTEAREALSAIAAMIARVEGTGPGRPQGQTIEMRQGRHAAK